MSEPSDSLWRPNVAAIIMDAAGQILLGATAKHLHFPQGGIKPGESGAEAVLREIREEVGLSHCSIVAEYPGLRYPYRHKNKKSEYWLGQQQTYYLLRCPGVAPATDCSGSAEFTGTRWLPLAELSPELFVPFKRDAITRALRHYFPTGGAYSPLLCTTRRYLYTGEAPESADTTPLFGGGKTEAAYHLTRLPSCRIGKKSQLLVTLIGMEGAGLKKSLRHIAHTLDPLTTHYHTDPRRYAGLPDTLLPLPGELSILALPANAPETAQLGHLEARLAARGGRALRIGLHLSRDKQQKRLADKGNAPAQPWLSARRELLQALAAAPQAYLIPADHGWYRDYLLTLLLREALEQPGA